MAIVSGAMTLCWQNVVMRYSCYNVVRGVRSHKYFVVGLAYYYSSAVAARTVVLDSMIG